MASTEIRDRRRTLRYRHLLVKQMVQTKNRVSGLLLETGVEHNKSRLHKVGYFRRLLATEDGSGGGTDHRTELGPGDGGYLAVPLH